MSQIVTYLGDPHNLGQRVALIKDHNGSYVSKPRSIYWEYLFLDSMSPFRKSLKSALGQDINIDLLLGHTTYDSKADFHCGTCSFVQSEVPDLNEKWFYNFGQSLALCCIFGFGDLHGENIIPKKDGIRIVDLECLFWDLNLARETMLLPKNLDDWKFSAIGSLINCTELKNSQIQTMIKGVQELIAVFLKNHESLDLLKPFLTVENRAVRIIIRDTNEYLKMLETGVLSDDLLPEERLQIQRGDVPYFWSYSGELKLYYMNNIGTTSEVKVLTEAIKQRFHKSLTSISKLLSKERISNLGKYLTAELRHLQKLVSTSQDQASQNH